MKSGNSTPINKTAALVMSRGVSHEFTITPGTDEWDNPPRFFPSDVKGLKNGRITVIGCLFEDKPSKLLCRCDCGRYVRRTLGAMNRKKEHPDVCSRCHALGIMKRNDNFRRTGKHSEAQDYL